VTPLPDPEALATLLAAGVADAEASQLAAYTALVLTVNRQLNLTGAKTGAAFAEHILDALTLRDDVIGPLVDVGSGNGLPGIPLAIVTGISVTLVEPILKRAKFLMRALEELGLAGEAVAERAEVAARDPKYREMFGSATARAVSGASTVAELTVPFLRIGGRALLQRGFLETNDRNSVSDAALVLGAEFVEERPLGGERRLLILEKRTATNHRFPRRDGVPGKRPLCI